jgi:holo-[acyl-carrier-protein] synthase
MIYGIGIDLVEIQRIKDMDNPVKFAEKILSDSELKLFK